MTTINSISALDLHCQDLASTTEFYSALTNAEPVRTGSGPGTRYTFDLRSAAVTLRQRPGRKKRSTEAPDGFAITVDADAPIRVMRLGADVLGGATAIDPDGRRVTMVIREE